MYCTYCSHPDTRVLESRLIDDAVRRRRECLKCTCRFTTYEKPVFNLLVLKKDGRQEAFTLEKIYHSIQKACAKAEEKEVVRLAQQVQQRILRKKTNIVKSTEIGKIVLQELKRFDRMAYVRFASIHKAIDDPKELENLIV